MGLKHIIKDLLTIQETLIKDNINIDGFEFKMFEQWWDNTSGGFETFGGDEIIKQMTYVIHNFNVGYVFFDGKFAYKVKVNTLFLQDVSYENVSGLASYKNRYS